AFGEPAAHPPPLRQAQEGEIGLASALPQIAHVGKLRVAHVGELRERQCRAPISTPLGGESNFSGLSRSQVLEVARGGIILPSKTSPPECKFLALARPKIARGRIGG